MAHRIQAATATGLVAEFQWFRRQRGRLGSKLGLRTYLALMFKVQSRGCPPPCGRPPLTSLNSCHRKISGERRSALAAPLGTLPGATTKQNEAGHEECYVVSDGHVDRNLSAYVQCPSGCLRIVGMVATDG